MCLIRYLLFSFSKHYLFRCFILSHFPLLCMMFIRIWHLQIYHNFLIIPKTYIIIIQYASNFNFYVKHSHLNILNNSFSRTRARIWNSIPADLCNLAKNRFNSFFPKSKAIGLQSRILRGANFLG